MGTGLQPPVAALTDAFAVQDQQAARLDLPYAGPHRRPGVEQQAVRLPQPVRVHPGPYPGVGEERLGLGGEGHATVDGRPEQRLDTEPVAHEQQPLDAFVPDGEGEHPVQVVRHPLAPLRVGPHHHLGVAAGAELVAAGAKFGAEFVVVVDLAAVAEDHGRRIGPVGHGLSATREVDDGQPAMADRGPFTEPHTARVGPPEGEGGGHGLDHRGLGAGVVVEGRPAGDSAHGDSWVGSGTGRGWDRAGWIGLGRDGEGTGRGRVGSGRNGSGWVGMVPVGPSRRPWSAPGRAPFGRCRALSGTEAARRPGRASRASRATAGQAATAAVVSPVRAPSPGPATAAPRRPGPGRARSRGCGRPMGGGPTAASFQRSVAEGAEFPGMTGNRRKRGVDARGRRRLPPRYGVRARRCRPACRTSHPRPATRTGRRSSAPAARSRP